MNVTGPFPFIFLRRGKRDGNQRAIGYVEIPLTEYRLGQVYQFHIEKDHEARLWAVGEARPHHYTDDHAIFCLYLHQLNEMPSWGVKSAASSPKAG